MNSINGGSVIRHQESAALRRLLTAGAAIVWHPHALKRAREREVSKLDAERAIRRAQVTGLDLQANGEERWRIAWADEDGCKFTVVVTPIEPDVLVITVLD